MDHSARSHEDHTIAGSFHFTQQVRVEKDRRAAIPQLLNDVPHEQSAQGIEAGSGLIEKHQLGIVDESLREPRPLRHPLAVFAQGPVFGICQVHPHQQLIDAPLERHAAHPMQPAVKSQQLPSRQGVMEAEMLRKETDTGPDAAFSQGRAEHEAASAAGCHEPQQQLQRGGLAGTVGSEEPEYLPATDGQRQVGHSHGGTELLAQGARLDGPWRLRHDLLKRLGHLEELLGSQRSLQAEHPGAVGPQQQSAGASRSGFHVGQLQQQPGATLHAHLPERDRIRRDGDEQRRAPVDALRKSIGILTRQSEDPQSDLRQCRQVGAGGEIHLRTGRLQQL